MYELGKMKEINDCELVKDWLKTLPSKKSQKCYGNSLRHFLQYVRDTRGNKYTIERIVSEREEDLESKDKKKKKRFENIVQDWIIHMSDVQKLSMSTIASRVRNIKAFFKFHDIDLKMKAPAERRTYMDKAPTREDIKKMLSVSKIKLVDKALVFFLLHSGQRVNIVRSMRYYHIKRDYEAGKDMIMVNVQPNLRDIKGEVAVKGRVETYQFLLGPECVEALDNYIKHMKSLGYPFKDDDFLFVKEGRLDGKDRQWGGKKKEDPKWMYFKNNSINQLIVDLAEKAGVQETLPTDSGRKIHRIHAHSFRKSLSLALDMAGVSQIIIDYVTGHSIDAVRRTYHPFSERPELLIREFRKVLLPLAIYPVSVKTQEQREEDALEQMKNIAKAVGSWDRLKELIKQKETERDSKIPIQEKINFITNELKDHFQPKTSKKAIPIKDEYVFKEITMDKFVEYRKAGWMPEENSRYEDKITMRRLKGEVQ